MVKTPKSRLNAHVTNCRDLYPLRLSVLKRTIFWIHPAFRDERDAGEFYLFTPGFALGAYSFDGVTLAVWGGGHDHDPKVFGGIPKDEVHDLAVGTDVEGTNKNICPWLDEPAL